MMLNFTVGPVMSSEEVRAVGGEQVPYFRTPEFSEVMFENERLIKKFANATERDKVVFITGSGTASMEAAVINCFTERDKLLIVNGGSFGQRFVDICRVYGMRCEEIKLPFGKALKEEDLLPFENRGFTGFLVNLHETSTGVLYDLPMLGRFCKRNGMFFVVDAISSFLADPIDFKANGVDVLLTGSQKALACAPGVSVLVLSENAVRKIHAVNAKCYYLNLTSALKDMERGQTPFTPAVGILNQLHARLRKIEADGGSGAEIERVANLANDFRAKIKELPFEIVSESPSNAATPLHPLNVSAYQIFTALKDEYEIWVCPNGGELKDSVFRVGHMGALKVEDNDLLIAALNDLKRRGLL